jgi:hypothetical protein
VVQELWQLAARDTPEAFLSASESVIAIVYCMGKLIITAGFPLKIATAASRELSAKCPA